MKRLLVYRMRGCLGCRACFASSTSFFGLGSFLELCVTLMTHLMFALLCRVCAAAQELPPRCEPWLNLCCETVTLH